MRCTWWLRRYVVHASTQLLFHCAKVTQRRIPGKWEKQRAVTLGGDVMRCKTGQDRVRGGQSKTRGELSANLLTYSIESGESSESHSTVQYSPPGLPGCVARRLTIKLETIAAQRSLSETVKAGDLACCFMR